MMTSIFHLISGQGHLSKSKTLKEVDLTNLANEYNLIQEKKSKLSRRQRDKVIIEVERLIKKGVLTKL